MAGFKNKNAGKVAKPGDTFDASPGPSPDDQGRPRNLQETKGWGKAQNKLAQFWQSYLNILAKSFANMSREDQENMISRFCQVFAIGIGVVALQCFYSVLILPLRVISFPLVVAIAWIAAAKFIAPAVIDRLTPYLNKQ
ncbi:MAG: hypothetical protein J0H83_14090 [Candidatus Melainabacteria bacterium]|jgi:hypothetical protein|nr:hypothetical protein [Candidatus Melainabacteria bacterium]